MATLENVNSIAFVQETMLVRNSKKLGVLHPDNEGYYNNFPVAALGVTSRNRTYYYVDDFVNHITDPNSYVGMLLRDGQLYGEWGHPKVFGMSDKDAMVRMNLVDEDRYSHSFRKIFPESTTSNTDGKLLLANFKPVGDKKNNLIELMAEPYMNPAFSLRSITSQKIENNVIMRRMKKLITFDAVLVPGYEQASKRYASDLKYSNEGLVTDYDANGQDIIINFDNINGLAAFKEFALEHLTNTPMNDILETNDVYVQRKTMTYVSGLGLIGENDKVASSVYHELMRS